MAWTTSGNLRDFFGARDHSAASTSAMPTPSVRVTGRHLRRFAVVALVMAHVALLGELTFVPVTADQNLSSATASLGWTRMPSLPWLTITGLILAILWLAPDWPTTSAAPVYPPNQQAAFGQSARRISTQTKSDPMTGLLARVSHDLRTPLNAVMGFSDLMQQEAFGPLGDSRYQSYARHIHTSSAELLKAAEDTLAMTALVASQRTIANEIADLNELVSDAFTMARLGAPKPAVRDRATPVPPVLLALTVPPHLQIKCERRALRQAMINLISAAMAKVVVTPDGMRTIHAVATTNEDVICLTVSIAISPTSHEAGPSASSWNSAEDLPICLARALLELQGLGLLLNTTPELWRAQVVLDGVSQSDFFVA